MSRSKSSISIVSLIAVFSLVLLCSHLWRIKQNNNLHDGLFSAIRSNDVAQVKSLLRAGADPNQHESPPRSVGLVGLIVGYLNPDRKVVEPTPLLVALYHVEHLSSGHNEIRYNPSPRPEIIQALLDKGADANATDDTQTTPLFFGVASGNTQVVDLLLKHGAKIKQTGPAGTSLLLSSASQGRIEMMQYLLTHGSDINERDGSGETALICTVRYARMPDAVKFLLDRHIDVNAQDNALKTALFYSQNPSPYLDSSQTKHLPGVITELMHAGAR